MNCFKMFLSLHKYVTAIKHHNFIYMDKEYRKQYI